MAARDNASATGEPVRKVATVALDALNDEIAKATQPVTIKPLQERTASCLVADAFAEAARGSSTRACWDAWSKLLIDEDESLSGCGAFAWHFVAGSLLATPSPMDAWLSTARALLPLQRRLGAVPNRRV